MIGLCREAASHSIRFDGAWWLDRLLRPRDCSGRWTNGVPRLTLPAWHQRARRFAM